MATTKEILVAARRRIENRRNWYCGYHRSRPFLSWLFCQRPECAHTAILSSTRDWERRKAAEASLLYAIGKERGCISELWEFNDTHTHADVLAMYDRAIEAAS